MRPVLFINLSQPIIIEMRMLLRWSSWNNHWAQFLGLYRIVYRYLLSVALEATLLHDWIPKPGTMDIESYSLNLSSNFRMSFRMTDDPGNDVDLVYVVSPSGQLLVMEIKSDPGCFGSWTRDKRWEIVDVLFKLLLFCACLPYGHLRPRRSLCPTYRL